MNKRLVIGLLAVVMMMALTGCCMSHEWNEATCTAPMTCAKCGETEGEVLAHTWVEATCAEAKHCEVCGATEGEALPHTLTEATYWQAATCTVCGAVEGEILQADFEKYGLECNVELNKIYDFTTACYDDTEKVTTVKAVFSNYKIFDSDDTHEAKEGYEWRTVDIILAMYDDNALNYGWNAGTCNEDYYDIVGHDASTVRDEETGVTTFTVNYEGIEYAECQGYTQTLYRMENDIEDVYLRGWSVNYLVPKGYNGCVYGLQNYQIEWPEGKYVYEIDNTDTLFFRFDNLEQVKSVEYDDVSEINLTKELAVAIVNNFYKNMINYIYDDTITGFFDFDKDMNINQNESIYHLSWALDKYNEEQNISLSEDATIKAAADYLAGKLNVPEETYIPAFMQ